MTTNPLSELPKLMVFSAPSKSFTMPCIFGKEYGENFISDWLCFCLDPALNGIGYEPLKMLLKCAGKEIDLDNEYADFESAREFVLEKDSRIDFLIPVYNKNTEPEKPAYYIAIENKILAEEGKDQTGRYYEHISKMKTETQKNVYIFLHSKENQTPKSKAFIPVLYKNLIKELKQIPLDFVSDLRRAFLFQEFLIHAEEYLIEDSFKLTQGNCDLIKIASNIINAYNENKENELTKKAYDECIKIKNIFFDMLYKKVCEMYSENQELIIKKSRQNLYIQIFKEEWKKYQIHYEIIIEEQKSIPHPTCKFLLMIHCEDSPECRDKLKSHLSFLGEGSDNFRKNFGVYEQRLDTLKVFDTPDSVSDFINTVTKELSALVEKSEATIDNFVAQATQ